MYCILNTDRHYDIHVMSWINNCVLRQHIYNLLITSNMMQGSISVSMSVYQTLFCFICSHLSSGQQSGDELRRNADVQEIHRRTQFSKVARMGMPQTIHDHEWVETLLSFSDLIFDLILFLNSEILFSQKNFLAGRSKLPHRLVIWENTRTYCQRKLEYVGRKGPGSVTLDNGTHCSCLCCLLWFLWLERAIPNPRWRRCTCFDNVQHAFLTW